MVKRGREREEGEKRRERYEETMAIRHAAQSYKQMRVKSILRNILREPHLILDLIDAKKNRKKTNKKDE